MIVNYYYNSKQMRKITIRFLSVLFFFFIWLRHNWQTILYKFKVYGILAWLTYTANILDVGMREREIKVLLLKQTRNRIIICWGHGVVVSLKLSQMLWKNWIKVRGWKQQLPNFCDESWCRLTATHGKCGHARNWAINLHATYGCFIGQRQSQVGVTETAWPRKPETSTVCAFTKNHRLSPD